MSDTLQFSYPPPRCTCAPGLSLCQACQAYGNVHPRTRAPNQSPGVPVPLPARLAHIECAIEHGLARLADQQAAHDLLGARRTREYLRHARYRRTLLLARLTGKEA